MCSIIASFDKDKAKELIKLNQHRGNFSFSITDWDNKVKDINFQAKCFGEVKESYIDICEEYIIAHVQAPTGGLIEDTARIHPVCIGDSMLWHNGIITPRGISYMQWELQIDGEELEDVFDTSLMMKYLLKDGFDVLNDIEGLFACLFVKDREIMIFRSKHGKLYIDADMNISSESFEDAINIPADTVYKIDLETHKLSPVYSFKTNRFNVVIPDGDITSLLA